MTRNSSSRPESPGCAPRSSGSSTPAVFASARTASGNDSRSWRMKAEDVAADSAAEAMEDALLGIDHERRRLLAVEGAEPFPVHARLAEVHEASDEVHDVHTRPDVVEDGRRVGGHRQLTFSAATVAPAPPSDGSPSRNDSTSG